MSKSIRVRGDLTDVSIWDDRRERSGVPADLRIERWYEWWQALLERPDLHGLVAGRRLIECFARRVERAGLRAIEHPQAEDQRGERAAAEHRHHAHDLPAFARAASLRALASARSYGVAFWRAACHELENG